MEVYEINRLVGEKVLQWEWRESLDSWVSKIGEGHVYVVADHTFSPATKVQDAWVVVNKLNEMGFRTLIKTCGKHTKGVIEGTAQEGDWLVNTMNENLDFKVTYPVYAKSAPLAICLSALKAVGCELSA
ncbi:BC1872 family protein [Cytobacillus oceanisediminis]|uniref:BC1872 family protein n=1 Tax=Cytobacillus oceanisediminis TaxID=665099 RepID=UPI002551AB73|nr:hypothetical protein [Cytobacillus oceanisediminis]MDK7664369.1 hypothetical protein [Cytobacillus oceanisediminis]